MDQVFDQLFPPRHQKGDQRRFEIIEAALSCIAKLGIDQTNYSTIGKRLGIGRAHVAYYFESKDEILTIVMRYITATAQGITIDIVKDAKTWREQVLGIVLGAFSWAERHPRQVSVLFLFYYYAAKEKHYRDLHHVIREAGAKRIQLILANQFPKKPKEKLRDLSYNVQALINGNLISCMATNLKPDLQYWKKITVESASQLLDAL
jgi:DNA-binding transcriptional regulator YbjK